MTNDQRRRPLRHIGLALGLLAVLVHASPRSTHVAAATDRLPDLRSPRSATCASQGRAARRRAALHRDDVEQGRRAVRDPRQPGQGSATAWDVDQIVYDSAGGTRRIETDAELAYAGDGHDHWHVRRMLTYHLWGAQRDAARRQDRLLLLRHEPDRRGLLTRRRARRLQAVDVRQACVAQDAQRHLGRLGRQVPVELRLPVDRHHRPARRDVHDPLGGRPGRSVHRESPRRTTATGRRSSSARPAKT